MGTFSIWIEAAGALLATLLGVMYGLRLARRGVHFTMRTNAREFPLIAALGLIFVFGNTAFLVAMNYPLVWWYVPVIVEYHAISVGWMVDLSVISFLFGTAWALAFRQRHILRWILPVLALAILVPADYAIRTNVWMRPPELGPAKQSKDGIILQSGPASCAAASCANIARAAGIDTNEQDIAAVLGTTAGGTTTAQIVYGMRRLGFRCTKRHIPDGDFTQLRGPAVLLVAFGTDPLGHAVAYMRNNGTQAEIWNPQGGKQRMTRQQLSTVWRGHAIEILSPAP